MLPLRTFICYPRTFYLKETPSQYSNTSDCFFLKQRLLNISISQNDLTLSCQCLFIVFISLLCIYTEFMPYERGQCYLPILLIQIEINLICCKHRYCIYFIMKEDIFKMVRLKIKLLKSKKKKGKVEDGKLVNDCRNI